MTIRCLFLPESLGSSFTLGAKVGERRFDASICCAASSPIHRKGINHFGSHCNSSPTPILAYSKPKSCKKEYPSSTSALSHIFSSFASTLSLKSLKSRRVISCIDVLGGRGVVLLGFLVGTEDNFFLNHPNSRATLSQGNNPRALCCEHRVCSFTLMSSPAEVNTGRT